MRAVYADDQQMAFVPVTALERGGISLEIVTSDRVPIRLAGGEFRLPELISVGIAAVAAALHHSGIEVIVIGGDGVAAVASPSVEIVRPADDLAAPEDCNFVGAFFPKRVGI